jgi:peptide-methionine (S)-S-oxide reductase
MRHLIREGSDMKFVYMAVGLAVLGAVWCVAGTAKPDRADRPAAIPKAPEGAEIITLGAGCFWRAGAIFQQIPGVLSVTAGYMGGTIKNPTYEQVCGGNTGHSEVSRIVFDLKQTSLEKILDVFWAAHHPTESYSPSARAVIFYSNDRQRAVAEKSRAAAANYFSKPIVTEIAKAGEFYAAEEYHQDYYGVKKHGGASCGIPSKLEALGLKK